MLCFEMEKTINKSISEERSIEMENEIVLKNIQKYYGKKQALKNISLTIHQGMFGLLGRNGAGKTTLMKVISTLLPANGGTASICGLALKERAKIREMIGYLPQDFSMYGNMKVYEAMDYLGVLSGLDKKTRKQRIKELLEQVNLQENYTTKVKAMSGGMKRRLGIAQAVLHNPKVLIVDEPTAGLDPEERVRFRNLLCEIAEDRIVILSTHIVGDIEATCEDIAIMNQGEIIYQGTVENLLEQAKDHLYFVEVSKIELKEIKERFLVTGMLTKGTRTEVRFISKDGKNLPENTVLLEPNVEDAYMYLMASMGNEQDTLELLEKEGAK